MNEEKTQDTNGHSMTEGPTNDQIEHIKQIDTIVVDADDVVKHAFRNKNNKQTLYNTRSFKITGVRSDGPCKASAGVDPRDDGAFYPDTPQPVWISPKSFVRGLSHDENDGIEIVFPSRGRAKDAVQADHSELDEDSDEFDELVDEYYQQSRNHWESAARYHLKDEYTFQMRAVHPRTGEEKTHTHTVDIQYE